MCIVIYAPAGVVVPEEHFENSFIGNSDGAGIMYNDKENVIIKKGFMKYQDFLDYAVNVPEDCDRVYHFRIATAGKISKEVCHPYPVVNNIKAMLCTDVVCDVAAAHNGIISWCNPVKQLQSNVSDSMVFLSSYLYPHRNTIFKSESFREIISHASGSKFAFMNKTSVKLVGSFIEENGVFYSNSSYKSRVFPYYNGGYYGGKYDSWDYIEDGEDILPYSYYGKGYYDRGNKFLKTEYGVPVKKSEKSTTELALYNAEISCKQEDVIVIKFYPTDYPDYELDYEDIDLLIQYLTDDLGVDVYNFEYDVQDNSILIVTNWAQITYLPTIVDGLSWKVV